MSAPMDKRAREVLETSISTPKASSKSNATPASPKKSSASGISTSTSLKLPSELAKESKSSERQLRLSDPSSSSHRPHTTATISTPAKNAPILENTHVVTGTRDDSTSEKTAKGSASKSASDDYGPQLRRWFRHLSVEERRKVVSIMDEEMAELMLLMSLKLKKEGPGFFSEVGQTDDISLGAPSGEVARNRSSSLSHLPPYSGHPTNMNGRQSRSMFRNAGQNGDSRRTATSAGVGATTTRSRSQTREPILRFRQSTRSSGSLNNSSSSNSSRSCNNNSSSSASSSTQRHSLSASTSPSSSAVSSPSASHTRSHSSKSNNSAIDAIHRLGEEYAKPGKRTSGYPKNTSPSSSLSPNKKPNAPGNNGGNSGSRGVKSLYPVRYFDDFFASDLIALNPYTPEEEDFLFRRHCSIINADSFTSNTIQMDEILVDAVRLCDAKQYLDAITLSSELLRNSKHFFNVMRVASRGEFLKKPCKMNWDAKTRTWTVEKPSWFTDMGYYTFGTFLASQFEMRLWQSYYHYANIDPRRETGHFGSGSSKASAKVSQNRHQDTLVSKSHLVEYWTRLNLAEKTALIRSMGNMIEARVKLDLTDLSYPQLLNFLIKLTSVSHYVSNADNPLLQPNNEREFIDFIFQSPLRRAGTGVDLVLRRLGVFIETAYVDKERADLILGEKMEKEKAQSKGRRKKTRHEPLSTSSSSPTSPIASSMSSPSITPSSIPMSHGPEKAAPSISSETETNISHSPSSPSKSTTTAASTSNTSISTPSTPNKPPLPSLSKLESIEAKVLMETTADGKPPSRAAPSTSASTSLPTSPRSPLLQYSTPNSPLPHGLSDSQLSNQALSAAGFMVAGRRKGPFTRSKDDSAAPSKKKQPPIEHSRAHRRSKDDTHSGTWTGPKRGSASASSTSATSTPPVTSAPTSAPPKSAGSPKSRAKASASQTSTAAPDSTSSTDTYLQATPTTPKISPNSSNVNLSSQQAQSAKPPAEAPLPPSSLPGATPSLKTSSESLPDLIPDHEEHMSLPQRTRQTSLPAAPTRGSRHGASAPTSPAEPHHQLDNDSSLQHSSTSQHSATERSSRSLRSSASSSSSISSSSSAPASQQHHQSHHQQQHSSPYTHSQRHHVSETMSDAGRPSSSRSLSERPHPTNKNRTMPLLYRSSGGNSSSGSQSRGNRDHGQQSGPSSASSSGSTTPTTSTASTATAGERSATKAMSIAAQPYYPPLPATLSPPRSAQLYNTSMRQSTPPGRLQGMEAWMHQQQFMGPGMHHIPQAMFSQQWAHYPIEFGPGSAIHSNPHVNSGSGGKSNHGGRQRSVDDSYTPTSGRHGLDNSHERQSGNWKAQKSRRNANNANQNDSMKQAGHGNFAMPPFDPTHPMAFPGMAPHPHPPFGGPIPHNVLPFAMGPLGAQQPLSPPRAPLEPFRVDFVKRPALGVNRLSYDITEFIQRVDDATGPRLSVVLKTIADVQRVVDTCFPGQGLTAEMYGSFSTNLGIPASDLDLVIMRPKSTTPTTPHHHPHRDDPSASPREISLIPISTLYTTLMKENWVQPEASQLIDTATVPVIKLVAQDSNLPVDITMEDRTKPHTGLLTRALTRQFCERFAELRPLTLVLKQMIHDCDIHNIYTGGISSYFLVILIVSYLQLYSNTATTLGGHLLNFLDLYGNKFNFSTTQISICDSGSHSLLPRSTFHTPDGAMSPPNLPPLNIIDPLNPTQTVGQSVFGMWQVQTAFKNAFAILHAHYLDDPKNPRPRVNIDNLLSTALSTAPTI